MNEMNNKSASHTNYLRDLGFPETVVEEAAAATGRGLFDMEPSPDLVRRTVERCKGLFTSLTQGGLEREKPLIDDRSRSGGFTDRVSAIREAQAQLAAAMVNLVDDQLEAGVKDLVRLEQLSAECIATIDYATRTRERPLMLVDNHNVTDPTWWHFDSGFGSVQEAVCIVNRTVRENGVQPAGVLMVLRPDAESYSDDQIQAIGQTIQDTTSDLWLVSYD